MRHEKERTEGANCGNSRCPNHDYDMDQRCSSMIGSDPAVASCPYYYPERYPVFVVNTKNKGWTFVRVECFEFASQILQVSGIFTPAYNNEFSHGYDDV